MADGDSETPTVEPSKETLRPKAKEAFTGGPTEYFIDQKRRAVEWVRKSWNRPVAGQSFMADMFGEFVSADFYGEKRAAICGQDMSPNQRVSSINRYVTSLEAGFREAAGSVSVNSILERMRRAEGKPDYNNVKADTIDRLKGYALATIALRPVDLATVINEIARLQGIPQPEKYRVVEEFLPFINQVHQTDLVAERANILGKLKPADYVFERIPENHRSSLGINMKVLGYEIINKGTNLEGYRSTVNKE